MSEYRLTEEILKLSYSKTWSSAKLEWNLETVYEAERCLCGHYPIIELCILKNKFNNQKVTIENCCVKKFLGLPSDKIFQAVKRVRQDNSKALNEEAIEYAFSKNWINEWEKTFYLDTMRKRNLSSNIFNKRLEINNKIAKNMKKSS